VLDDVALACRHRRRTELAAGARAVLVSATGTIARIHHPQVTLALHIRARTHDVAAATVAGERGHSVLQLPACRERCGLGRQGAQVRRAARLAADRELGDMAGLAFHPRTAGTIRCSTFTPARTCGLPFAPYLARAFSASRSTSVNRCAIDARVSVDGVRAIASMAPARVSRIAFSSSSRC